MANRFSPVYTVDITSAINAGQTATVASFGQAFELVNVLVSGNDGANVSVRNTGGAVAAVAVVNGLTAGELGGTTTITNANTTFASTANITIVVTAANVTRVVLFCRAADSIAREITVTVA